MSPDTRTLVRQEWEVVALHPGSCSPCFMHHVVGQVVRYIDACGLLTEVEARRMARDQILRRLCRSSEVDAARNWHPALGGLHPAGVLNPQQALALFLLPEEPTSADELAALWPTWLESDVAGHSSMTWTLAQSTIHLSGALAGYVPFLEEQWERLVDAHSLHGGAYVLPPERDNRLLAAWLNETIWRSLSHQEFFEQLWTTPPGQIAPPMNRLAVDLFMGRQVLRTALARRIDDCIESWMN